MAIASAIERPKVEAEHSVSPTGALEYVSSQVGRTLDIEESRAVVIGALATGSSAIALTVDETLPVRPDASYAEAKVQLEHVFDAPIELVANDQTPDPDAGPD